MTLRLHVSEGMASCRLLVLKLTHSSSRQLWTMLSPSTVTHEAGTSFPVACLQIAVREQEFDIPQRMLSGM